MASRQAIDFDLLLHFASSRKPFGVNNAKVTPIFVKLPMKARID